MDMEVEEMAESSYAVEEVGHSETLTFSGVQGDYDEEIITEESVIEEQIVSDKIDSEETSSFTSPTDYAGSQFPASSGISDNDSYGTPVARTSTSYQEECEVREADSFVRDETAEKDGAVEEMFDNEEECMEEVVGAEEYEADDIIELEEEEALSEKEEQETNDGVDDEDAGIETIDQEHHEDDMDKEDYVTTQSAAQDHIEDFTETEEEVTERVIELDEHMSENDDERVEHVEEIVDGLEENIPEDLGEKDLGEDATEGTEADIQAEENTLEENEEGENKTETEDKQNLSETSEREGDCTLGTEASFQSVGNDSAERSMLQDGSPNTAEQEQSDVSTPSADPEHPATPIKQKSRPAIQHKVSRRKSAVPRKKAKLTKTSVPTVTVTAPSDQSEESEIDTPSAAPPVTITPTFTSYPKKIESSDRLPTGWRRIAILRLTGKHMGRYDTTLFSDTNVKMRSFPNVQAYLEKTGQQDLLEDKQYDFKFNQPFSKEKGKGRTSTPKRGNVKASPAKEPKRKTPKTNSVKGSKKPTTAKVCMTLKRKLPVGDDYQEQPGHSSPDQANIWEVMPTQKPKARKKTTAAAKNSPQLKLDGFISKNKSSQVPKESKFKSSFKSVLQKNKSPVKEAPIVKEEVKNSETVADSDSKIIPIVKPDDAGETVEVTEKQVGNVEEENDLKEEEVCQDDLVAYDSDKEETVDRKDNAERGDSQVEECNEDVYLAEEQDVCRSDEDENKEKTDHVSMEMAGAREQGRNDNLSEECASDASIFEIKSAESDNSLPPVTESLKQSNTSHNKTNKDSASNVYSTSVARTSKRSRSHSDSDMSADKRARLWREGEVDEDWSRSVGMCSDTSLPGQEDEDNQHMASKVQHLHLSDSSSSKDMKDSASTSSSNSTSLTLATPLLDPSWKRSKAKSAKSSPARSPGKTSPAKKSASGKSHVESGPHKSETMKTNGAAITWPQVKSHRDMAWTPPRSPFNLIQERLYHDPWKMLVATIFLQELEAEAAIPLLWKFLNRWPTAEQVRSAETERIARLLHPMERNETCAATVVQFSEQYETIDWMYPIELHGIDKYGNDSFRIFCVPEWKQVAPDDERLKSYHTWLCDNAQELGVE